MLNASKYKTSCLHRLLLKSWQNVTQLQIYRTFIFWLRWRPSSNLIVIIFPLLLVIRGNLQWCVWVRREWDKELKKEVVCSQSCSSAGKQIGDIVQQSWRKQFAIQVSGALQGISEWKGEDEVPVQVGLVFYSVCFTFKYLQVLRLRLFLRDEESTTEEMVMSKDINDKADADIWWWHLWTTRWWSWETWWWW